MNLEQKLFLVKNPSKYAVTLSLPWTKINFALIMLDFVKNIRYLAQFICNEILIHLVNKLKLRDEFLWKMFKDKLSD